MIFSHKNNTTLLLGKNIPLTCMMKGKATLPKITYPAIMEECQVIDKCPYGTSQVVMEYFVNDELEDSIRKDFFEKNDKKANYEVRQVTKET